MLGFFSSGINELSIKVKPIEVITSVVVQQDCKSHNFIAKRLFTFPKGFYTINDFMITLLSHRVDCCMPLISSALINYSLFNLGCVILFFEYSFG